MGSQRRSSLEVAEAQIAKLNELEKKKARYEKLAADTSKPIHWAAIKAVAAIAIQIASIVKALKRRKKRK